MLPANRSSGVSSVVSTTLTVIRHGETAWNVDGRIQGQRDIPLNDNGRAQAAQLAQALRGERIDALLSSDLQRAFETARHVASVCGLPIATDASLRERHFGEFEGHLSSEIAETWPLESALWHRRDPDAAPPGGESLRAFSERCVGAVLRIATAHAGRSVVVVAHGGVLDCLYRAATGTDLQSPRSWPLPNAAINRLTTDGSALTLVAWGDTSHITGAARDEPVDAAAQGARRAT